MVGADASPLMKGAEKRRICWFSREILQRLVFVRVEGKAKSLTLRDASENLREPQTPSKTI